MFALPSDSLYYSTDLFSLIISPFKSHCVIRMDLHINEVTTHHIPLTYSILKDVLPSILKCVCFNQDNNPFSEEVKKTEIGHLFEHIVLEYLSLLTCQKKKDTAVFNGSTYWDWDTDNRGTFHITIDAKNDDYDILRESLDKSIHLLTSILRSN
ncbi:hypothetical protein A3D77_04780 [Candidatus Gottesmanbacteria bacterium RIFCSPHIGHO2_02_FULL_39_11]|uniref:Cyanophycin synthase-like N-terminal domain-containing protein n=1 Tax=Candidatus Gottesmanbacteria bacterium RIFCSPHIGHO2_02_FULL_39_11 TaxID=1798382 RepID=A0A1F5ZWK3_9BACT|nr:MAG: hypothetical protein A3D77_04780 [Candidatus Gottesmanbacteria bacterium RIFCSPHIGHO2_02_FULL_39_11]